ncbi:hypothetical protein [Roseateles sp.]|uniref:hypothetical protein n=1 Tax=Roseateles sp. TaxID=1971397 RepID=UPI0025F6124C|nr:hypothetical protein [Roseateles sp.]MBV8036164.1 hypothetical protein [Roseateles sp.]
MNFQHAFVSMIFLVALIGLAFLGVSLEHALRLGDLALMAHHPLFSSGVASLSTAALGGLLLQGLSRPSR